MSEVENIAELAYLNLKSARIVLQWRCFYFFIKNTILDRANVNFLILGPVLPNSSKPPPASATISFGDDK